jgi:hypothetical protein
MPEKTYNERTFDARPDRIDLRDRLYQPKLVSLPSRFQTSRTSTSDLQSAIYEVGAIYASANVHKGWFLKKTKAPAIIPFDAKDIGGHAFALMSL